MSDTSLILGTRGSPLALAQARQVAAAIAAAHPSLPPVTLRAITTAGDRFLDRPLMAVGGKGLFTGELDQALLSGGIDLAVHSMKDLPTRLPEGLGILAVPLREDPRDAWISPLAAHPDLLAPGLVVGTASLRRQAQLRRRRPDLRVEILRGNVQTRLAKLQAGAVAGTFLALAGLKRLGTDAIAGTILDPLEMLPAAGQGALALVGRLGDARVMAALAPLEDPASRQAILAERAALDRLDGSCRTPIGALARMDAASGRLRLDLELLLPDGSASWAASGEDAADQAEALGIAVAERLLSGMTPAERAAARAALA